MRTYTVTRKKGSKVKDVRYSVGSFSFHFTKGVHKDVPELIAVRIAADYPKDYTAKLDAETAEPEEFLDFEELTFDEPTEEN